MQLFSVSRIYQTRLSNLQWMPHCSAALPTQHVQYMLIKLPLDANILTVILTRTTRSASSAIAAAHQMTLPGAPW